jgi:hypothetical protein
MTAWGAASLVQMVSVLAQKEAVSAGIFDGIVRLSLVSGDTRRPAGLSWNPGL